MIDFDRLKARGNEVQWQIKFIDPSFESGKTAKTRDTYQEQIALLDPHLWINRIIPGMFNDYSRQDEGTEFDEWWKEVFFSKIETTIIFEGAFTRT